MPTVRSKLQAHAPKYVGLAARELIDRIMKSADEFVAGAPQHDDMTVVVVRLV